MKIIGISPRLLTHEKVEREFVNKRYVRQFTSRGINVLMVNSDNPNSEEILKLCDGFVITGGYDIDPKFYGEENNGKSINCSLSLDNVDRDIVIHAATTGKPLLGICRGHQSINVFLGGSLFQDIGNTHDDVKTGHVIYTEKNRLLPFKERIEVNSYHHQAINRVAPNFDIIARAEDGTIEAMIHKHLPIICIQWHPEIDPSNEANSLIFDVFTSLLK